MLIDGVVKVNELVDLTKCSCLLFEVDFEKMYDLVRCNFMDYTLTRFSFNNNGGPVLERVFSLIIWTC